MLESRTYEDAWYYAILSSVERVVKYQLKWKASDGTTDPLTEEPPFV